MPVLEIGTAWLVTAVVMQAVGMGVAAYGSYAERKAEREKKREETQFEKIERERFERRKARANRRAIEQGRDPSYRENGMKNIVTGLANRHVRRNNRQKDLALAQGEAGLALQRGAKVQEQQVADRPQGRPGTEPSLDNTIKSRLIQGGTNE